MRNKSYMNNRAFFNYLQYEKRFSPHTLTAYRSDLEQFIAFVASTFSLYHLAGISHHHVRAWVVHLLGNDIATSSVRRKLSVLKTWFRFLLQQGEVEANPMQKVQIPKTGKRLPVYVPEKSMHRLLDDMTWPEGFAGRRDQLIIGLLYHTGMRRAELLGLKLSDIDLERNLLRIMGKGQKERLVPFGKNLQQQLEEYLSEHAQVAEPGCPFLIITDKGKVAYPRYIYGVVKKYLSQVTTIEKKSPHVLRHTFATHLSDRGADLNAVKELLGHSNLAATQIYTHNSIEKLKRVYQKAHPKGKMDDTSQNKSGK